jgi:tetratricopeptide (TPR) repeat protein
MAKAAEVMEKLAAPAPDSPAAEAVPVAKPRASRSQKLSFGEPIETNEDTALKVTRNNPSSGINPNLLAAYEAFNAGDNASAQRLYRQVLQGDVRNVDALLGMAAIAARQGRNSDAMGWYGKVLEVEPRNSVAQAAMVGVLGQVDPVGSESRIKNLLAQQPHAAHLHAALGNLYAEQNQWPSAQQAYFQAHQYDANNAEYTFNLAVSLDQLGKPALALQYYKTTLELLPKSGVSSINRTQVESRIAQLQ